MENAREIYLAELKQKLSKRLSNEEVTDIIEFYSEYLEDANINDKSSIESKLGTPKQLANKVLADYSINNEDKVQKGNVTNKSKSNVMFIWIIILALLSSPITIPIGIALIAVLFTVLIGIFALLVGLIVGIVAFILGAGLSFYTGIMMITTDPGVALYYSGIGIASLGLLIVAIPLFIMFIKWIISITTNLARKLYKKVTKKGLHSKVGTKNEKNN